MPLYLILVSMFMCLAIGLGVGLSVRFREAFVKSLADKRLKKIQDGNEAAYQLWYVMRDKYSRGHVDTDYFIGFSHALNLGDVITDEQWRHVRLATGGDS